MNYGISEQVPGGYGPEDPPAAPRSVGHAPAPPARRLPNPSPVPKSDTMLYVGLAVIAVLIVGLLIAVVVGVVSHVSDDDAAESSEVEN